MYFLDSSNITRYATWCCDEIPNFCGGFTFHSLSISEPRTLPKTSKLNSSFLEGFLAGYTDGHSMFINDCEEGYWDKHLFSKLPSTPLTIGDVTYYFYLTPFYFNPSSGNQVRSLTILCIRDHYDRDDDDEEDEF